MLKSITAGLLVSVCLSAAVLAASPTAAATTADMAWLAGTWEGRLTSGPAPGVAEVTFQKPNGGLVTGVMRLVDHGKIVVIELIAIVDAPEGMELRFRHFSTALEAYEPTFKQKMRIKSSDKNSFTFENLVPYDKKLDSTQPRVTTFIHVNEDQFIGHSDIIGDDGKPGTVEVTYRRVK